MKELLSIVCGILLSLSAVAATSTAAKTTPPPAQTTTVGSIDASPSPQLLSASSPPPSLELAQQLKAQLALIKEYHQSLLDTVYWALGVVATMALFLAGFSWFTNFKLYESDKQRLKDELARSVSEVETIISARLSANETDILKLLDARIDSITARIANEIGELRLASGAEQAKLKDSLEKIGIQVNNAETKIEQNAKSIFMTEAALRQAEEIIWEIRGIPENVLLTQVQGLGSVYLAKNPEGAKSILARINETITKTILPKNISLPKRVIDILNNQLKAMVSIDAVAVSELQGLLGKISISPDQ